MNHHEMIADAIIPEVHSEDVTDTASEIAFIRESANKVMMSVPNPKRSVPVSFLSLPDEDSYSPFLDEPVEPVPNPTRDLRSTQASDQAAPLRPTSTATPEVFEFFNDSQPQTSTLSVRSNGTASVGDQSVSRGVIGSARKCKSSNSNGPSEGDAILGSWPSGLPGGFLSSASTPIGSGVIRAASTSPVPTTRVSERREAGLLSLGSDLTDTLTAPWEHERSRQHVQHMPICRPSSTPAYPTSITSLFKASDFELGLDSNGSSSVLANSNDLNVRNDGLSDLLRGAEGSGSGTSGWWEGQSAQPLAQQAQQPQPSVRGRDRDYSFGSLLGLRSATAGLNLRDDNDVLTSSSDRRRVPFGTAEGDNSDALLADDLLADRPSQSGGFFDLHNGTQTRRENLRAGLALGGTVSAPPQFLTGLYASDGYGVGGLGHSNSSARPLSINTYASAIGGQNGASRHHSPSPAGTLAHAGSPHPIAPFTSHHSSRSHSPVPQTGYSASSHSPVPQLVHRQSPVPGPHLSDISAAVPDDSSVEGAVLRSCREILAGAAEHSLKAVELANTLRARVGTESLARVREQWGGLLSLLEKHSTHFRVDRIPKNDKVTLISTDDSDDTAIFGEGDGSVRSPGLRSSAPFGSKGGPFSSALSGENGTSNQSWNNQGGSTAAGASAAGATRCLHVGNVPANMSEVQLMREFEKFGQLDGLKLVSQRNGTRRFAFITFHSIEQAITARHCLSKVHPWKSAISFAHKEFTQHGGVSSASGGHAPPHHQQQHHMMMNHAQMGLAQGTYGSIPDYQGNMLYQMQNNHQMMMAQANMMYYPYLNSSFNGGMGGQQTAPFWMQQPAQHHLPLQPFPNPGESFLSQTTPLAAPAMNGFPASTLPMQQQQQQQPQVQPQAFTQPGVDLDCPVLRRLCDDTYVPTQPWPVDLVRDLPYCNAVIAQLQHFDGYTTISKLRGFLRNRVAAVDNIKSVPLKAMLVAYPQYFVLVSNYVHLVNSNASTTNQATAV